MISKIRKHWSLMFDILMASLILWVWFFGIKVYCDPMMICPDLPAYLNRTRDVGLGYDIIEHFKEEANKNLTPMNITVISTPCECSCP